jgi:hypothetical protein
MSGMNFGVTRQPGVVTDQEMLGHFYRNLMAAPQPSAEPMGNSIRRLLAQSLGSRPEFKPRSAAPGARAVSSLDSPPTPRGPKPLGPAAMAYNKSLAGHSMTKPLTPAQQKLYEAMKNEAWSSY